MSKSVIYSANTSSQTVASGGVISPGTIVRRFGCALDLNGNGITASDPGYYNVNVSVTAEPAAAGTVTISLINNGITVPGATASATAAAAGDPVNVSLDGIIRVLCGAVSSPLTLVLSGEASTVTNVTFTVVKI